MSRSVAILLLAALSVASAAEIDMCSSCKANVNKIAKQLAASANATCSSLCQSIAPKTLCSLVCPTLKSICTGNGYDCGDAVCRAISICETNPWEYEVVWNFTRSSDKPTLAEDTVVLTSSPPSDDVPPGLVKVGLKCEGSTWWKAITMFKGSKFLKEVAATQDHKGIISWGFIRHEELADHYFTLSKAKFLGVHVNVYHITNAADMKERGTYLFDWQVDSTATPEVQV